MQRTRGESRPHGARRREQIITASIELFAEVGYRGASLRDIASRAGITHPGLLYHFGSKEELLAAVLKRRDDVQEALINQVGDLQPEHLVAALITLTAQNQAEQTLVEMFATLAAEATDPQHPAHDYFVARYIDVRRRFTRYATVLADAGILAEGVDPGVTAVNLIALMDGLQVQWLHDPGAIDMVAQLEAFLRTVTRPGVDLPVLSAVPPAV